MIFLKGLVLLLSVFFIFNVFRKPEHRLLFNDINYFKELVKDPISYFLLSSVILLAFVNIAFEAFKWKFISEKLVKISFKNSLIGVLLGFTFGFITPNGIGDYLARITSLESFNRSKLIVMLFFSRISLLIVTLIIGAFGVNFWVANNGLSSWYFYLYSLGAFIVLIAFFLLPKLLYLIIELSIKRFLYYVDIIKIYAASDLFVILLLSAGRYFVFVSQFVLLFIAFQIDLPIFILFGGATFIFLVKSAMPTFSFLGDLSIREMAAISFFQFYIVEPEKIVLASLVLWIVNIVLPSIVGFFFINKLKFTN
jgi:uncharacterized membrane protein YbhN (UPF0104 family)